MVCQAVNYDKCCTTSSPVCSSPVIEAAVWGAVWRAGQGLANYYSGRQMLLSSSRIIASRPQLNFIPNYQSCYESWDPATIIQLYLARVDSYNWYYECFLSSAAPQNTKQSAGSQHSALSNVDNRFGHWRYWIIMREPQAGGSECKVDKIFCINLFIFGNLQKYCLQTSQIIW